MRRAVWILSTALLVFVSVLRPNAWTLLPCALLLLTPPISWLLLLPQRRHIHLELTAPAICTKGQSFTVRVSMHSDTRWPIGLSGLTLHVENAVTGESTRLQLFPAPTAEATLCSRYCGCIRLETVSVCLYDLFGVLPLRIPCRAEKRTLVMPDTVDVTVEPFLALAPLRDSEEYAQDRKGQDRAETFQVRDYVPGDSLSQIHWKLSGKQGKLIVRDGSYPVDQSLLVYLDRFAGDLTPEQADALLEAVVSVCQALSEAKMPFRVGWNGETPCAEDVAEPTRFTEVIALLLNLYRGERGGFTQYLRTYGPPVGGRVLYFGAELPTEWDALCAQTAARAFLCTDRRSDRPDIVGFTPETVQEALREVSW